MYERIIKVVYTGTIYSYTHTASMHIMRASRVSFRFFFFNVFYFILLHYVGHIKKKKKWEKFRFYCDRISSNPVSNVFFRPVTLVNTKTWSLNNGRIHDAVFGSRQQNELLRKCTARRLTLDRVGWGVGT